MNLKEVAAFLRRSVVTIRRYVRKREIPFYKVHKGLLFKTSEIEIWMKENRGVLEEQGLEEQLLEGWENHSSFVPGENGEEAGGEA
jgi:excisionase family DNA binding protein